MDRDPGGLLTLKGHKDRTNIIFSLPPFHQHKQSAFSAPGDVTFTRVTPTQDVLYVKQPFSLSLSLKVPLCYYLDSVQTKSTYITYSKQVCRGIRWTITNDVE